MMNWTLLLPSVLLYKNLLVIYNPEKSINCFKYYQISIIKPDIGLAVRVFANGLGDPGSIPG